VIFDFLIIRFDFKIIEIELVFNSISKVKLSIQFDFKVEIEYRIDDQSNINNN
jgi:hypothetical protein